MATASPSTSIRAILKGVLETEFAAESLPVLDDRLHASLGSEGAVAGIYPLDENEVDDRTLDLLTRVRVQVYGYWDKQIDNAQTVDPAAIEAWAHRFRVALRSHAQAATGDLWYVRLVSIEYPPDPTGNITRFEATVIGHGANSGLVETG